MSDKISEAIERRLESREASISLTAMEWSKVVTVISDFGSEGLLKRIQSALAESGKRQAAPTVDEDPAPLTDSQYENLRAACPGLGHAWSIPAHDDFWRKYLAYRQGPWATPDMFRRMI